MNTKTTLRFIGFVLAAAVLLLGAVGITGAAAQSAIPGDALYPVKLYDAFPLLGIAAVVYTAAAWGIERRLDPRALLYTGAGTALGLVINPYFPHNIVFAVQHILPKLTEMTAVRVGNEWYPYTTAQLLENSPLALAAFFSGTLALGLSGRRMDARTLAGFGLAGLFGLMLLQARRFVEYFPPFGLVFAAFAWSPVLERWAEGHRERGLRRQIPALVLALVLVPGLWSAQKDARAAMQSARPYQTYADARPGWRPTRRPGRACFKPTGMISRACSSTIRTTPI